MSKAAKTAAQEYMINDTDNDIKQDDRHIIDSMEDGDDLPTQEGGEESNRSPDGGIDSGNNDIGKGDRDSEETSKGTDGRNDARDNVGSITEIRVEENNGIIDGKELSQVNDESSRNDIEKEKDGETQSGEKEVINEADRSIVPHEIEQNDDKAIRSENTPIDTKKFTQESTQTIDSGPSPNEKEALNQVTQANKKNIELQKKYEQLDKDFTQMTTQMVKLRTECAVIKDENNLLIVKEQSISKKLKEAQTEMNNLTQTHQKDKDRLVDIEKKLSDANKKNTLLNDEVVSSKKTISDLTKKNEKLDKEVHLQQDEAKIYTDRIKQLQSRIEILEKENESILNKQKKREKEFEEIEKELRNTVSKAQSESKSGEESLKKIIIEHKSKIDEIEQRESALKESMHDLQDVSIHNIDGRKYRR